MPSMVDLGGQRVPMLNARDVVKLMDRCHDARMKALRVLMAETALTDDARAQGLATMDAKRGDLRVLWDWCRTLHGAIEVVTVACAKHSIDVDTAIAGMGPGQVCDLAINLIYPPAGGDSGKALVSGAPSETG